ncbi:MAG TPA: hypothetical protein VLR90_02015 [Blastocatellia bacterium]|nr:hypothetical protein [Blastocatellia bacterium]
MKKIVSLSLVTLLLLSMPSSILASDKKEKTHPVPSGSKVYISKMENDLDGFITTEIIKKKLPVTIVTEDTQADFILVGASIKGDDKWYHTVFGGKDKNEGNVRLLSSKEKTVIWAGEAGDRSLMWGGWKRGGQRKVADRIVSKMKKELFEN